MAHACAPAVVGASGASMPSPQSSSAVATAIASASRARRAALHPLAARRPLATLQRTLTEPPTYAHAAAASFAAALHASPSRSWHSSSAGAAAQPAAALPPSRPSRGDSSPASTPAPTPAAGRTALPVSSSLLPLSYAGESALLHDAQAFLACMAWGLRMPSRVAADAAVALAKHAATVPLQSRQLFVLAPVDDSTASLTPSASPAYGAAPLAADPASLLSPTPPHSLYILATASLFLSCKAMDTPRKLNDFVDAHIVLVTMLQRIRKGKEGSASQRRKGGGGVGSLERVRAVWRELYALCAAAPAAAPAPLHSFSPSSPSPIGGAPLSFHPASLEFPSSQTSFVASGEWSALRESLVYAEFLLLTTATEFAFNNVLTCLDHEGQEGSPLFCVQRLLWQLIDGESQQQQPSGGSVASSVPSTALSLRCSQLAWMLTQLSLRSSIYLHSNAYMVAIAIVFLAARRFGRPAATAAAQPAAPVDAAAVAMEDVPVAAAAAPDVPRTDEGKSKTSIDADVGAAAKAEFIDLDACADRLGWAPRFRVVDAVSPGSVAPTPLSMPLRWYHALCPAITDALLLSLCEIIVEAALAAPPLPSTPGAESLATDLQHLADAYPWGLAGDAAAAAAAPAHTWSNAADQVVVAREPLEAESEASLLAYEEPYPRPPRTSTTATAAAVTVTAHESMDLAGAEGYLNGAAPSSSRSGRRSSRSSRKSRSTRAEDHTGAGPASAAPSALPLPLPPRPPMPGPVAPVTVAPAAAPVAGHGIHPSRLAIVAHASAPVHAHPAAYASSASAGPYPPRPEQPHVQPAAAAPLNLDGLTEIERQLAIAKEAIRQRVAQQTLGGAPAENIGHGGPPSHPAAQAATASAAASASSRRSRSQSRSSYTGSSRSRSYSSSRSRSPRRTDSRDPRRRNDREENRSRRRSPSPRSRGHRDLYGASSRSDRNRDRERERSDRDRERSRGGREAEPRERERERDRRDREQEQRDREYREREFKRPRRSSSRDRQHAAYYPGPARRNSPPPPLPPSSHARAPPQPSHPGAPYRDGPPPPRDELCDPRGLPPPPSMQNAPPSEHRGPDGYDSRTAHPHSHPQPLSAHPPHGAGEPGFKRRRDEFEPPPPDHGPANYRDGQGRGWRGSGGGGSAGGGSGYQQHASNNGRGYARR